MAEKPLLRKSTGLKALISVYGRRKSQDIRIFLPAFVIKQMHRMAIRQLEV